MLKIGVVAVKTTQGGVKTFIDNFSLALSRAGHDARIIDFSETPLFILNSFDIIHFSEPYFGVHSWKLLFLNHPKKILTVHGWLQKEILVALRRGGLGIRKTMGALLLLLTWKASLLLSRTRLLFDAVTCPSKRTAEENSLKTADVISNGIFPEDYSNILPISVKSNPKQIIFSTYSNIGGLKDLSTSKVIHVVDKLNQLLTEENVILLVFGPVKPSIYSDSVRFMGFSRDFKSYLKGSDLFIMGYSFPEVGYSMLEAAVLGIPVARFIEKNSTDELVKNKTAILAENEEEMVNMLSEYILNIGYLKPKLGNAVREYVCETRSWDKIILKWNGLFQQLLDPRN